MNNNETKWYTINYRDPETKEVYHTISIKHDCLIDGDWLHGEKDSIELFKDVDPMDFPLNPRLN